MKTNDLVIIDYATGKVHIYKVNKDLILDNDFLDRLGFRSEDIEWVVGNLEFIKHKGIIVK